MKISKDKWVEKCSSCVDKGNPYLGTFATSDKIDSAYPQQT